jgi:hypothetical protein
MYTEAFITTLGWTGTLALISLVPYLECPFSMIPVPVSVAMGPSRAGIGGCELPNLLPETLNSR